MPTWVIRDVLARAQRPGYLGEQGQPVDPGDVDAWLAEVKTLGVKSIICLLGPDQLGLYQRLPTPLVDYYRQGGFNVNHIPVQDHLHPPLSMQHLDEVWQAYSTLAKPVLVHCSAGIDRTRAAVDHIQRQIDQEV